MTPENKNAAPVEEAAKGVNQRENSIAPAQKISNRLAGATPEDWTVLSCIAGVTEDLLPIVSYAQGVVISPKSSLSELGKVPSEFNYKSEARGISAWTTRTTTQQEIQNWSKDGRLGIGIQTRIVRALDVDVTDKGLADRIEAVIVQYLPGLPRRGRSNSSKFLYAFTLPGDYTKRNFPVREILGEDGKSKFDKIELLATGEQFAAIGTHPSGVRYEWRDGTPDTFPEVSAEAFEALWAELVKLFAIGKVSAAANKAPIGDFVPGGDPVADFLYKHDLVVGEGSEGQLHIDCPFQDGHTDGVTKLSSTSYMRRTEDGRGGVVKCQHASCAHRSNGEFIQALGYDLEGFEDISEREAANDAKVAEEKRLRSEICFVDFASLAHTAPPTREWVAFEWIPRRSVTALFGAGGHGKSLIAQQLAVAVANGRDWLGIPVQQGPVLGFFCEDDSDELLRRGAELFSREGLTPEVGGRGLYLDARAGKDNLMVTYTQDRRLAPMELLLQLRKQVETLQPALVILDNIAQIYGGQENVRNEVTAFCNELTGLARAHNCAVLLIGHTAKAVESEFSGSTAWDAAVRSRLYIGRSEDGTTQFSRAKSNYSGLADMKLRYVGGAFEPIQEDSAFLADEASVEAVREDILRALGTLTRREVSTSASPTARNYLPKLMADDGTPRTYGKKEIAQVLNQMIERGEIEVGELPWKTSSRHPARGLRRAEK